MVGVYRGGKGNCLLTMDDKVRAQLKDNLMAALRPRAWRKPTADGYLLDWFLQKLEGLVGYSLAERIVLSARQVEMVRLRYEKGVPVSVLCRRYQLSQSQLNRQVSQVLDAIIDHMPPEIRMSLTGEIKAMLAGWCKKCGGVLEWDNELGWYECQFCGEHQEIESFLR